MNRKIFGILLIFSLFVILASMSFVSAVLTLNTPAVNANITGTIVLNATLDTNNGGALNLTRAWFYAMYPNGTNITIASFVENVTNIGWNTTWDTNNIKDFEGLRFWAFVARGNGTVSDGNQSVSNANVVVDNSAPTIFLLDYTNATIKGATNLTINISFVDSINLTRANPCIVDVNGTNQTIATTIINNTYATCNTTTLSLKGLGYGNQTIKIYAGRNTTGWSGNLMGQLITYTVFIDTVGPTVELTTKDITKDSITLTISASDPVSGVSSCTVDRTGATVTGTTEVSESGLSCSTSYTYNVTCNDGQNNPGSTIKTVSTNACGISGGGGGGAGTTTTTPAKVHSFSEIKPGVASVVKDFSSDVGVKQISIEVNNPAQNVKVTVTKYDGKPAAVSVAKTGKVLQYVQINVENIKDKLSKATVEFRAEKSKVSNKDKVVVSKFDETAKTWNDLPTTFSGEDSNYYYYTVELGSFSYFAISEKAVESETTTTGDTGTTTGTGKTTEKGSMAWLWIVIAIVVLILIGYAVKKRKQ